MQRLRWAVKIEATMILRILVPCFTLLILAGCDDRENNSPQEPSHPTETEAPKLLVVGEVDPSFKLYDADWKNLPRTTIRAKEKDGKEVAFEGVLLRDVLKQAGVKLGDKPTHRERLLLYVVAEATDGYKILFSLQEIDPDVSDKVILIADRADDKPLAAKDGPLRIVVPDEKLHVRWIRQLTMLKVCRAPE